MWHTHWPVPPPFMIVAAPSAAVARLPVFCALVISSWSCSTLAAAAATAAAAAAAVAAQALIYPMTVTSNTASETRQRAALHIIHEMRATNERLVEEANLVSREMMDVAITWHELWYQGLEDAANLYFTDKDMEGMLDKLDELHDHWSSRLASAEDAMARPVRPSHSSCRRPIARALPPNTVPLL